MNKSNINIDFVTVINDFEIYDKYFTNNDFVNIHKLIKYDNRTENIPITKRFNDYINNKIEDNTWVVFCHQDFEIQENIEEKLRDLDKNSIYGPIGAGITKHFVFFIRMNGFKIAKARIGFIKKMKIKGKVIEDNNTFRKIAGSKAKDSEEVETLDCCCFILHSDLIKKMKFNFDENLDWHLYSEDLSLLANHNYKIKTRIINFSATHHSSGNFDKNFYLSLDYLKNKYKDIPIVTTVFDGIYEQFLEKL